MKNGVVYTHLLIICGLMFPFHPCCGWCSWCWLLTHSRFRDGPRATETLGWVTLSNFSGVDIQHLINNWIITFNITFMGLIFTILCFFSHLILITWYQPHRSSKLESVAGEDPNFKINPMSTHRKMAYATNINQYPALPKLSTLNLGWYWGYNPPMVIQSSSNDPMMEAYGDINPNVNPTIYHDYI